MPGAQSIAAAAAVHTIAFILFLYDHSIVHHVILPACTNILGCFTFSSIITSAGSTTHSHCTRLKEPLYDFCPTNLLTHYWTEAAWCVKWSATAIYVPAVPLNCSTLQLVLLQRRINNDGQRSAMAKAQAHSRPPIAGRTLDLWPHDHSDF